MFFINTKLIAKPIDISFQLWLKAYAFVLASKVLDAVMSTSVFSITLILIPTAWLDSDPIGHLNFDRLVSFSHFFTYFDASSNDSVIIKENNSLKHCTKLQNYLPGDFISYIFILFDVFLQVLFHQPVAK